MTGYKTVKSSDKRRESASGDDVDDHHHVDLFAAMTLLKTAEDFEKFFIDLCTPKELKDMAGRWLTARLLSEGLPYRQIYEQTGVSTVTVTRVARSLETGAGGYRLLLGRCRTPLKKKKFSNADSTVKNSHSKIRSPRR
jgi:TrpR-related protein YerC/YecD